MGVRLDQPRREAAKRAGLGEFFCPEMASGSFLPLSKKLPVTASCPLAHTLPHKKKPTLVPAPFTHRMIGRSASFSDILVLVSWLVFPVTYLKLFEGK